MKAIILAGGEGKRMNSDTHKVLHKILDKPIINYVIDNAYLSGISDICVVLGHKRDEIRESLKYEVEFAIQEEQLGTGHAVMMAVDFISDEDSVIVLYGDTPLIKAKTLKLLLEKHETQQNDITVASTIVDNPKGYGRIVDKNGKKLIVEEKDTTDDEKKINEINTGVMCFKGSALKSALSKLKNNNSQNEYYLTDVLEIIQSEGKKAEVLLLEDSEDFLGINTKVQLYEASCVLKKRINELHMINGVTIIDPLTTYISESVKIGSDTIIYPNTFITGTTVIGKNCIIGSNCNLTNMTIDDGVEILSSTAVDSSIGKNTHVGPYAYLRPNSHIGENCKIGDFVEVKNATFGNNSKASHLAYIGDAEVGDNVNFGCAAVTVNYDGKKKFKTIVKDNSFIGCNTNLVAPVVVEESSYIAAGSTITKDVPEKALAIARSKQVNKENWIRK